MFMFTAETVRLNSGWNRKSNWREILAFRAVKLETLSKLSRDITMSSNAPGKITSQIEVTHISSHGIWLLTRDRELFMSYEQFPWFKDAPVKNILNVEEPRAGHFYWPDLDVDLSEEIISHPERFPLKAK